jgi:hypothetical protein
MAYRRTHTIDLDTMLDLLIDDGVELAAGDTITEVNLTYKGVEFTIENPDIEDK